MEMKGSIKSVFFIATILMLSAAPVLAQSEKEYIELSEVKLNGKLAFKEKMAVAAKVLGANGSRDQRPMECGSYFDDEQLPSYRVYIKGIVLEECAGVVVLSSIDLGKSPDAFVAYPGGRWDKNTTFQQVQQAFPRTAKEAGSRDGKGKVFWIHTGKDSDDFWVLEFAQGKLVCLKYLVQC